MIDITAELFKAQDLDHRSKRSSSIPSVDPNTVIGVKYSDIHKLGDRIFKCGEAPDFMRSLPHRYFEENCLHAYLINKIGCFDECIAEIKNFLPHIENWFVCDMINPKALKKYPEDTFCYVCDWINSNISFAQRLGINTMINVFSKEAYDKNHIKLVNDIVSEDYYVSLAKIRYFCELLIYHYEDMIMYMYQGKLDTWIHNETISKALISYRVPLSIKEHLRDLKLSFK